MLAVEPVAAAVSVAAVGLAVDYLVVLAMPEDHELPFVTPVSLGVVGLAGIVDHVDHAGRDCSVD